MLDWLLEYWLKMDIYKHIPPKRAILIILLCWLIGLILFVGICRADDSVAIETIAREASGECFEAQVLVGQVIKVRMRQRNKSSAEICKQPAQFSCWNPGVHQKARTKKELDIAQKAWETKDCNIVINLYHDVSVNPWWAKSDRVRFVKQVGNLRFYKE